MPHFIYASANGHLDYFCLVATVNSAMNMAMQISQVLASHYFGYVPEVRLLDHILDEKGVPWEVTSQDDLTINS